MQEHGRPFDPGWGATGPQQVVGTVRAVFRSRKLKPVLKQIADATFRSQGHKTVFKEIEDKLKQLNMIIFHF